MPLRRALMTLSLAAALLPAAAASAAPSRPPVRLNQIQVIGTHNSYHREMPAAQQAVYEQLIDTPGDYGKYLAYSHATLPNQLAYQDVRGLELDVLPDPQGGLYAEPLVRTKLGLGPLPDPAWRQPGIKVLHIPDFDVNSTCISFVSCLEQVKGWSDANPGHVPLQIMLEFKQSDRRAVAQGGVTAPPWDAAALEGLDREIRSVFGPDDLVTPADVRRPRLTLEQSVLRSGWPTLADSRGKVLFLMDNEPGTPVNDAYIAGHPNLEGRVVFSNGLPGRADAAFLKRNDPVGRSTAEIQALVRRGYLVRTRSDSPLATVTSGDVAQRDAALASGAQLVSTDFPDVGMSARYGSDFVARLPRGGPVRCNPVNAPRGCRSRRLEPRRSG